jgi:hypothetical protein
MGHRLAHEIHALDIVVAQAVINTMVMYAFNTIIVILIVLAPGDDVHVMPSALQAGGKFRHVHGEAASGNGMQGFRRKHGDTHGFDSSSVTRETGLPSFRVGTRLSFESDVIRPI